MKTVILLIVTSILWAGNFVAGKDLVGHASALTLTELRWLLSAVCLVPVIRLTEQKFWPQKSTWLPLLGMSATGVVLFNVFTYQALEHTSADQVGLLSALNPLAIALASLFFLRERLRGLQWIGMFISLAGVVVVITSGRLMKLLQLQVNQGDLWMLLAVAIWGIYAVFSRQAMRDVSPYLATFWSAAIGAVVCLPFTASGLYHLPAYPAFWYAAGYTAVLGTVVAMVFWNLGVLRMGGTVAGMFLNLNPIFTVLIAFFTLDETVGWAEWLGTALVIGGMLLFAVRKPLRRHRVQAKLADSLSCQED